jgi:hypothetical protein
VLPERGLHRKADNILLETRGGTGVESARMLVHPERSTADNVQPDLTAGVNPVRSRSAAKHKYADQVGSVLKRLLLLIAAEALGKLMFAP